jgi:hypothetical protein
VPPSQRQLSESSKRSSMPSSCTKCCECSSNACWLPPFIAGPLDPQALMDSISFLDNDSHHWQLHDLVSLYRVCQTPLHGPQVIEMVNAQLQSGSQMSWELNRVSQLQLLVRFQEALTALSPAATTHCPLKQLHSLCERFDALLQRSASDSQSANAPQTYLRSRSSTTSNRPSIFGWTHPWHLQYTAVNVLHPVAHLEAYPSNKFSPADRSDLPDPRAFSLLRYYVSARSISPTACSGSSKSS